MHAYSYKMNWLHEYRPFESQYISNQIVNPLTYRWVCVDSVHIEYDKMTGTFILQLIS